MVMRLPGSWIMCIVALPMATGAMPWQQILQRHRVGYAEGVGAKLTDPRRMAAYFAKYVIAGGKEYQHRVSREWRSADLVCDDSSAATPTSTSARPTAAASTPSSSTLAPARLGSGLYRGLRPVLAIR